MEINLSEKDIEAISSSIAEKIEKSIIKKPVVYSVEEVASTLKCHRKTVIAHINAGLIKAKRNGKGYNITLSNLNKYLNEEV